MSGEIQNSSIKQPALAATNWQRTAIIISNITAPPMLAVPTYVVLGLYDQSKSKISVASLLFELAVSIFFGVFLPIGLILFLYSRKLVSDMHISIREQRTIPYLGAIAAYLIAFGLIYSVNGQGILAAVMICYAINTIVIMGINFGWKVSAHATGVGGPLAALTLVFGWSITPLYVLIPLVGWARVFLKAHTIGQVTVGTLLGFGLTLLQLSLIFRPLGWI
jgi:membrane-associated phospholipid phosphatase